MRVPRSMSITQRAVLTLAFVSGFALAWYLRGEVEQEVTYREKANFCIDRMKNKDVAAWWKMKYCDKVKLDAIDPITGSDDYLLV